MIYTYACSVNDCGNVLLLEDARLTAPFNPADPITIGICPLCHTGSAVYTPVPAPWTSAPTPAPPPQPVPPPQPIPPSPFGGPAAIFGHAPKP